MQTKSKLMFAVLAALAMSASSAFARGHDDLAPPPACDDQALDGFCGPNASIGVSFTVARNGADDVIPEGLDDNGVDPLPHA